MPSSQAPCRSTRFRSRAARRLWLVTALATPVAVALVVGSVSAQVGVTLVSCGGENQRICEVGDPEFGLTAFARCDRGLKSDGSICVNESRRLVSVDAWTDWALRNQSDLAIDEPINWVSRLASHNSFNASHDGYPFPNHVWSMTDQLRLGARHLDLDLHFVNDRERFCHGTEGDAGCSPFDRMYAYGILEIGNWLNSPAARNQIVTISFEEPESGQDAHVEDPLVAYFGSKLAPPADFPQFTTLGRGPTTRELLDGGRQVVVMTRWDTHGGDLLFGSVALGGDTGILFYEDANGTDLPNVQFEPETPLCKTGLQNGTGFNLLNLFDKFSLIAENRLFVFPTWDITSADVSRAAHCLVSSLALDEFGGGSDAQNNPTDFRHQSAIWSWLPGDMGNNGNAVVMLQNSANRWASRNPLEVHQFLCGRHRSESPGDPNDWMGGGQSRKLQDFKVTTGAGTWFQGGQYCLAEFGEDYVFSVPVSGFQNVQAALASDVISTWMNYNDAKEENKWVINKRPLAEAGEAQTLECTSASGAVATLNGTLSTDPENDSLTYAWSGPFGTATGDIVQVTLPLGTHTVRLVTDDGFSGVDPDEVAITVQDTTGPVIESLTPVPPTTWPPNHKMVPVAVTVKATDACDPNAPRNRIVDVTSNESPDAKGAGKPGGPDWQITGPLTVNLNSERSGNGPGRIYTLTIESADASGNKTLGTTTVLIPHDNGNPNGNSSGNGNGNGNGNGSGNGDATTPPGRGRGTGRR